MRKLLALFLILVPSVIAQAPAGRVRNSLPARILRNEAGMVKVMVTPWKHPLEAPTLWGDAVGTGFDYYETRRGLSLCIGCAEGYSLFLGQHPQPWRIDFTAAAEFALTGGLIHAGWSHTRDRVSGKIGWEAIAGSVAGFHVWAGLVGKKDADVWDACWDSPACTARNRKPSASLKRF